MAAVDISSNKNYDLNLAFVHHSPYRIKAKDFDTSLDANLLTQATHTIFDVEVGEAFMGFDIIVTTAFTSAGAPTMTFNEAGGEAYTGAILKASLAAGSVLSFFPQTLPATGQVLAGILASYAVSAATTITMTIGTADYTAGRAFIIGRFLTGLDKL